MIIIYIFSVNISCMFIELKILLSIMFKYNMLGVILYGCLSKIIVYFCCFLKFFGVIVFDEDYV